MHCARVLVAGQSAKPPTKLLGTVRVPDWMMRSRRGLAIWAHCVVISMVSLRTLSVPAKVHFVPSADGELRPC